MDLGILQGGQAGPNSLGGPVTTPVPSHQEGPGSGKQVAGPTALTGGAGGKDNGRVTDRK